MIEKGVWPERLGSFFIVLFALLPPVYIEVPQQNMSAWTAVMVFAGFLGIILLYTKVNIFVKAIAFGGYINCFLSAAPIISFTSYLPLLFCCYFYLLCTKIKDWKLIFNVLFTILLLECLFMIMQILGKDPLLNFGFGGKNCYGTIGNKMQLESFIVVVSVLALQGRRKIVLAVVLATATLYTIIYGFHIHIHSSFTGRMVVWVEAFKMSNWHPFVGWGIGTFKFMFTPLTKLIIPGQNFSAMHNEWLQVFFETGYPGLILMVSLFSFLTYRLIKIRKWLLLAGLLALSLDMSVHFPLRTLQCPLIVIAFLAFLEQNLLSVIKKV